MDQPTPNDGSRNEDCIGEQGDASIIARRDIQNLFLTIALGTMLFAIVKQATSPQQESTSAGKPISTGFRVNVNQATVEEIALLPQVGPILANRIVTERDAHGPFLSVEDLARTPGIGPDRITRFRPLIETDR